jgi:hypothetical protein
MKRMDSDFIPQMGNLLTKGNVVLGSMLRSLEEGLRRSDVFDAQREGRMGDGRRVVRGAVEEGLR